MARAEAFSRVQLTHSSWYRTFLGTQDRPLVNLLDIQSRRWLLAFSNSSQAQRQAAIVHLLAARSRHGILKFLQFRSILNSHRHTWQQLTRERFVHLVRLVRILKNELKCVK